MKKTLFTFVLAMFFMPVVFSQNNEIGETGKGRTFRKVIENNLLNNMIIASSGKVSKSYNLNSKTAVEKLMFGDVNAMIEFFVEPSFGSPHGFRIVRDSTDTGYFLESKCISNWEKVSSEMSKKHPSIGIIAEQVATTPKEEIEQTAQHNSAMYAKQLEEGFKNYIVDIKAVPIKDDFAKNLYVAISSMVKTFVMEGEPASILGGNEVTFRCVVGDEIWTLIIQEPDGAIGQLADLCNRIIGDMKENIFNETKYVELLNPISTNKTIAD
jgi:hypothetical protein